MQPVIQWLLPNGSLVASSTNSVSATFLTSLLIVDPVRVSDRGIYRCNVSINNIPDVSTVFSEAAIEIRIMSKYKCGY